MGVDTQCSRHRLQTPASSLTLCSDCLRSKSSLLSRLDTFSIEPSMTNSDALESYVISARKRTNFTIRKGDWPGLQREETTFRALLLEGNPVEEDQERESQDTGNEGYHKCVETSSVVQSCLNGRLTPRLTVAGGLTEGLQENRGMARRSFLKAYSEDYNIYFVTWYACEFLKQRSPWSGECLPFLLCVYPPKSFLSALTLGLATDRSIAPAWPWQPSIALQ
ncbi:uncharacterized protein LOC116589195 [Mustela erminea]|uniref:uncharacterized protein LOC116589195 n=1 Tax=Mustela erminea TaxID=36723 RepID=UPI0013871758|nr:uncharacterized protein LOC116589195 [Mustela erminea]